MGRCTENIKFDACKINPKRFDHLVEKGYITKKQLKFMKEAEKIGFTCYIESLTENIPASARAVPHFEVELIIKKTLYNEVKYPKKKKK